MAYFPFFSDIKNKKFLVVGGGKTALRKIKTLAGFGCECIVIAPEINEEIYSLVYFAKNRNFEEKDLENIDFAVVATDDKALNKKIACLCRNKKIPVNSVTDLNDCDFVFPAVYRNKDVVVGISTGGKSPFASAKIRRNIEKALPKNIGDITEYLGEIRDFLKDTVPGEERKKVLGELWQALEYEDMEKAEKILERYKV